MVEQKIKKWDHIAIRPITFNEFRKLRGELFSSDDAFLRRLMKTYIFYYTQEKEVTEDVRKKEIM